MNYMFMKELYRLPPVHIVRYTNDRDFRSLPEIGLLVFFT